MPPRKNDQTLRDIQMEEMRRQIQQLQETVNAQQTQLEARQQLSKKSSFRPFSSTKYQIDSHKPLTHQPVLSFKPYHNTIKEKITKIPKCFVCQGYGHIALDCVNHKVLTIVNGKINNIFEEEREDIYESFEDETLGEPIYDEEYVGSDICEVFEEKEKEDPIYDDEYGPDDIHEVIEKEENDEAIYDEEYPLVEYDESLEVRKSLQTTTAKEELLLGHDIFNTHFTDMASNDIINKSGENDGSKYIEELKFPMINHPDPYKLQWFNKGNEVKVSQHFIISFSIDNNYKENVWCDVIPMDTCHINLGRPCQYDRRALYDGYVNTCFFVKDVIEIKLAPLPVNEFNDGEEVFKLLGLSLTMEPFKDKTKSCLLRPVPKPPWENVIVVAVRIKKKLLNSRTSSVQPGENDTE